MVTVAHAAPISSRRLWTARILGALPVLFLLFDGAIKLIKVQPVIDSMETLGYPDIVRGLGVLELVCTLLYAFPRTALLGAILLTGLFGGAIATHVRVGDPWFSHVFFSLYLALPLWLSLWLRDDVLRTLLPLRTRRV